MLVVVRSVEVVRARRERTLVAAWSWQWGRQRRHELRREITTHVRLPDRATVDAVHAKRGIHRREVRVEVREVAQKVELGPGVVRGRDDLRKIDDSRPVDREQHVVGRQIAVDEIAAEQGDQLCDEIAIHAHHRLALERDLLEPRRRPALGVEHERHEEHALVEHHRLRRAHAGIDEAIQRVGLGRLPGLLGGISTELATAVHGALGPRVANLAAFLVLDVVLEAASVAVLVDLGREDQVAAADHRDGRFLAALDPAKYLVDHAIVEQRVERVSHGRWTALCPLSASSCSDRSRRALRRATAWNSGA